MNLLCIGGDRRTLFMSEFLHNKGFKINNIGLGTTADTPLCAAVKSADAVLLPLPVSNDNKTVRTPLAKEVIYLDDIVLCQPKLVLGGMINNSLCNAFTERNIPFFDYYKSEPLTLKNALLTAEAALSIAIKETEFSLFGSSALVLGYGRIGKILSRYLKALGASVTATSRNVSTIAAIETDGFHALNTSDILEKADRFDLVFNTVPSPIMNRQFFGSLKKRCLVLDLATASGLDFSAAEEYKIKTICLPGLPGKFFPLSAGELIGAEILNILKQQKEEETQ
jgi:dipicolinate synthase subunit A